MNIGKVFSARILCAAWMALSASLCLAGAPASIELAPADAVPVALSDDGSLVLLSGPTRAGLQLLDTASGSVVAVTAQKAAGHFASISPDNQYVCYKGFKAEGNTLLQAPMLFRIADQQTLQLNPFAPATGTPAVSATGRVAYTVGNQLIVLNADLGIRGRFDLGHHVNLLAFSPNGEAIAYNDSSEQIVVLDLATGVHTAVTDGKKAYWGPKFSPDGSKVLAGSVCGSAVCAAPGSPLKILGKGSNPAWLDADTVAFVDKTLGETRVELSELVIAGADGALKSRSVLNAGDAVAVMAPGAIVSAQGGNVKLGALNKGQAAWKKDLRAPAGLGGETLGGDIGIESVIQTGNIVEIVGVPVIHQVYDTLDDFCGSSACGATAALMAIQYSNLLPAHPVTVSYPYTHVSDYGFYISENYTYNGHTYNVRSRDCASQWAYGGYGYIVQNNWEDTKTHMAEYISYHGPASGVDWSPTFAKAQAEVLSDCPFVLLNSLTSAGHYITATGFFTDQYTLVFNDPYGNKNTPGYPSYDGERVFYDWPGYNYGNQNLVTVWCFIWCRMNPLPTPIPTVSPTPSPTPAPGTDVIVDNDNGSPFYSETGTWATSGSTGYNGGTYRYATAGGAHTATWTAALAESGNYDVYAIHRSGTNRPTAAKYVVHASSGDQTVYINQTVNDLVWVHLGLFPFAAGNNSLTIDAAGSTPAASAVIADAVRFTLNATASPTPSLTPSPSPTVSPSPTPSLTPSPTPVAVDMYVNDIAMSSGSAGKNYYARAAIWIKNASGGDVSGATVFYTWSGSVNQTSSAVTAAGGKVTVQSPNVKNGGTFTLTVNNVTASGYTYNSALNVETSDTIVAP